MLHRVCTSTEEKCGRKDLEGALGETGGSRYFGNGKIWGLAEGWVVVGGLDGGRVCKELDWGFGGMKGEGVRLSVKCL